MIGIGSHVQHPGRVILENEQRSCARAMASGRGLGTVDHVDGFRDRREAVIRWAAVHPRLVDVGFALLVGGLTLAGHLSADETASERSPNLWSLTLLTGLTIAFAYRRRRPLASMAAVVALTVTFWVADFATQFEVFSLLTIYAAAAHGGDDRRRVWRVVGLGVAAMSLVALVGVLAPSEDLPAVAVIGIAAIHLTAAVAGDTVYERRRRVEDLERRAARAESERELLTRQAVLAERARIARDLHDVVAHGLSVMVVQAGAAQRMLGTDPERSRQALDSVQSSGRQALGEMRRMLGVLRSDEDVPELSPQPTLDDLDRIVQECSDAGVPTELTVDGEPPIRSAGAEMVAYRIVQEALTNVIRHAGRPVEASVRVTYAGDQVRLEIDDTGRGAQLADVEASTGHGLLGMRERVELYRGTLRAGPRPGGGFRVAATIPLVSEGAGV
jgi:signal transduction histidine kinase